MAKTINVGVLNTIQAAGADLSLSKGKLSLDSSAADQMGSIDFKNIESFTTTAYSAGVARVFKFQYSGVSLAADVANTVYLTHNGETKSYSVISASTWASATALVTAIVDKINADASAAVVASQSTSILILTQKSATVVNGTVTGTNSSGATVYNTGVTAYVAPSGTEGIVNAAKAGSAAPAGTYTTYTFVWKKKVGHNAVSGLDVYREVQTLLYVKDSATNYAAFNTALGEIIDATAGAGSSGIDTTSAATVAGSIKRYIGK